MVNKSFATQSFPFIGYYSLNPFLTKVLIFTPVFRGYKRRSLDRNRLILIQTILSITEIYFYNQRLIQNPAKHLQWCVLQKQPMAHSRYQISQNSAGFLMCFWQLKVMHLEKTFSRYYSSNCSQGKLGLILSYQSVIRSISLKYHYIKM